MVSESRLAVRQIRSHLPLSERAGSTGNRRVDFRYRGGRIADDAAQGHGADPYRPGFKLGMYERTKIVRGTEGPWELCSNRNLERALIPRPSEPVQVAPPTMLRRRVQPPALSMLLRGPFSRQTASPAARLKNSAEGMSPPHSSLWPRDSVRRRSRIAHRLAGARRLRTGVSGLDHLSTLSYLGPNNSPSPVCAIASNCSSRDAVYAQRRRINGGATWSHPPAISTIGCWKRWPIPPLYLEKHKGIRATDSVRMNTAAIFSPCRTGASRIGRPIALGVRLLSSQNPALGERSCTRRAPGL